MIMIIMMMLMLLCCKATQFQQRKNVEFEKPQIIPANAPLGDCTCKYNWYLYQNVIEINNCTFVRKSNKSNEKKTFRFRRFCLTNILL
jgi:quinol-cytochrome oxidoreductase complex cytochrome b subunit